MMLFRVPVAKMFFEGAPRLLNAGVNIQPCSVKDDPRLVVEAYPALAARRWIGNHSYKADSPPQQTADMRSAREHIIYGLRSREMKSISASMSTSGTIMQMRLSVMAPAINWMLCYVRSRQPGPFAARAGFRHSDGLRPAGRVDPRSIVDCAQGIIKKETVFRARICRTNLLCARGNLARRSPGESRGIPPPAHVIDL